MYRELPILGITLARGGSKGIPRKNLQTIKNKPLVEWAGDAMSASKYLDYYVISSEDAEILDVCTKAGFRVSRRPDYLAQDETTSAEVLQYTLEETQNRVNQKFAYVVELMCTAPLTSTEDIDGFIKNMIDKRAEHSVSVVPVTHYHPSRLKYIQDDKLLSFYPEPLEARRQDLEPDAYIRNGALYGMTPEALYRTKSKWGHTPTPYIMDPHTWINIDSVRDLDIARAIPPKVEN